MKFPFRLVCVALIVALGLPLASAAVKPTSRLVNISSRGVVASGDDVMIAGFVIGGNAPKDVLVRALGPALMPAGVKGVLAQPQLQIYNGQGQLLKMGAGWSAELKSVFAEIGASTLADHSHDTALRLTLAPGAYTAQVRGLGGYRGIALVEVYEIGGEGRLLNLSTRARVETGDGILISGFVVAGTGARRLLLRGLGPSLAEAGVSGVLMDPSISLLNANGSVVATNDNWEEGAGVADLKAISMAVGAGPLRSGSKDAAMVANLLPGVYSVHVRGVGNTSGVTLFEAYDVTDLDGDEVEEPENHTPYTAAALSWDVAAVSARLGPTFEQLNPGAPDDRPTIFTRESKMPPSKYYLRIKPYELGTPGDDYKDYWSETGQVGYVPDDPINDPGVDRVQLYAYYNNVFALSPRFDWPSGKPHPDPQTRDPNYVKLNGGTIPLQPVAMVRGYGMQQNEQVMVYRDGLFAVAGMQTSRSGSERPFPGFKFPAHKVPRGIAVTTSNEFALVTIWDTQRNQGQLAVVAMEGKYLPFHTWPYMGLPNQGSFSDFKLLGYIDLPMKSPQAVAAASNGLWQGPSSTDGRVLSQIKLTEESRRKLVYDGAWQFVVAKGGYAIVSSTEDNKVVVVDLTPLFAYFRDSYLKTTENFNRTIATRGAEPEQFPQTFDVNPSIMPKVVWQMNVEQPTAVLAGQKLDRWSRDRFKAYVATRSGMIHIIDTSSLMKRNSWEVLGELKAIGSVQVGRNPVHMAFTRREEAGLPLIPYTSSGEQRAPDPYNNMFYVACRGERSVDAVVTYHGEGQMYRRIRDKRMHDPVAVSTAVRGNILTVCDFNGKKIISFRMGNLRDTRNDILYPPGDPVLRCEFVGELPLEGSPFMVTSANLN